MWGWEDFPPCPHLVSLWLPVVPTWLVHLQGEPRNPPPSSRPEGPPRNLAHLSSPLLPLVQPPRPLGHGLSLLSVSAPSQPPCSFYLQ